MCVTFYEGVCAYLCFFICICCRCHPFLNALQLHGTQLWDPQQRHCHLQVTCLAEQSFGQAFAWMANVTDRSPPTAAIARCWYVADLQKKYIK